MIHIMVDNTHENIYKQYQVHKVSISRSWFPCFRTCPTSGDLKDDIDIDTEITGMTTTSNHKVHTGATDKRVLDEGKLQPP